MRKIIIATHGYMADGVKSSIEILCGKKENIFCIDAYTSGKNEMDDIEKFFKSLAPNDEIVIFTDIAGGSVTQKLLPYSNLKNVYLIAGFNLPIVLEIILKSGPLSDEYIEEVVENCREQLIYVRQTKIDSERSDEDFFMI